MKLNQIRTGLIEATKNGNPEVLTLPFEKKILNRVKSRFAKEVELANKSEHISHSSHTDHLDTATT